MRQPLPFRKATQRRAPRRPLLDPADRAALATLGGYALTLCLVLLALLVVALVCGLAVRLFWIGVG
jgi:uncharacterized iron-regulated membrane protein